MLAAAPPPAAVADLPQSRLAACGDPAKGPEARLDVIVHLTTRTAVLIRGRAASVEAPMVRRDDEWRASFGPLKVRIGQINAAWEEGRRHGRCRVTPLPKARF
jgi:hypothetical protein